MRKLLGMTAKFVANSLPCFAIILGCNTLSSLANQDGPPLDFQKVRKEPVTWYSSKTGGTPQPATAEIEALFHARRPSGLPAEILSIVYSNGTILHSKGLHGPFAITTLTKTQHAELISELDKLFKYNNTILLTPHPRMETGISYIWTPNGTVIAVADLIPPITSKELENFDRTDNSLMPPQIKKVVETLSAPQLRQNLLESRDDNHPLPKSMEVVLSPAKKEPEVTNWPKQWPRLRGHAVALDPATYYESVRELLKTGNIVQDAGKYWFVGLKCRYAQPPRVKELCQQIDLPEEQSVLHCWEIIPQ